MKNFFEINNVTFAASKKNKVNNVSLKIENEGDVICLLGPSGIGKTTILRTIAGLEKINAGSIRLNGKVISSNKIHVEPEDRNISLSLGSTWILLDEITLPFKLILPELIFSNPAIVLKIVVLPIPEGPRRQITSPSFSIFNETLLTLFFLLAAKVTLLISKKFFMIVRLEYI